jgi:hypothetical protein
MDLRRQDCCLDLADGMLQAMRGDMRDAVCIIWDEAATGRAGYLGIEVVLESRLCLKVTDIHILQSPSRDSQPHLVYPSLSDTLGHGRISFATPTLSIVPNF